MRYITLILMMLVVSSARAMSQVVGGITWTYTVKDGKAYIGGGNSILTAVPKGTTGAVTIPSVLGKCPVAGINAYAFYGLDVGNMIIPKGVQEIGCNAFTGCVRMGSVSIPEGVTNISDNAFTGSGLTSVTIPSTVRNIGKDAFRGCSGLCSVVMQNGVREIGCGAFFLCENLRNLTISEGVTDIGDTAFYGCVELSAVTIPASVLRIGVQAFCRCGGEINVVNGNPNYTAVDGVLFSGDMTELISFPCTKRGDYSVPSGVTNFYTDL